MDTKSVKCWFRDMRKVTITLGEETARWVRVRVAENELSVSRFVGRFLREKMEQEKAYRTAMKNALARRPVRISSDGRYPSREELHDRPVLRRQQPAGIPPRSWSRRKAAASGRVDRIPLTTQGRTSERAGTAGVLRDGDPEA